jgi:oxygen-independent coproporphyrinogen-3 oxidase
MVFPLPSRVPEEMPYPTLLPFQVFDYPIAHLMHDKGPVSPQSWPPTINPKVAEWKSATDHLPEGGNLIYVHIPFCPFFCHFCFLYKTKNASDRRERKNEYTEALLRHIQMVAERYVHSGRDFNTIYFGGGTPSELEPSQLGRILRALRTSFPVAHDAEITLEIVANKRAYERLDCFLEQGFNRISFGVQTLDPELRRLIGRGESLDDYDRLVQSLADRPTIPFNVDLMIGLPGQTINGFVDDVRRISQWGTNSVDVYTYWMVPGSKLYESARLGEKAEPVYGMRLVEFRLATKRIMRQLGYHAVATEAYVRNESNNFMKSTFGGGGNALGTSLAFGPSAFGFVNGTLHRDIPDLAEYIRLVQSGLLPFQCRQTLDRRAAQTRALLMGIQRLTIPREVIQAHYSWRRLVTRWIELGLAEEHPDAYQLTEWGAVWFNQMQLEVVPIRQRLGMANFLGSAEDQLKILSSDKASNNGLMGSFSLALRNGTGVLGDLRMAGYKGYLQLKRFIDIHDRAYDFSGEVTPAKVNIAVRDLKGLTTVSQLTD